MAVLFVRQRGLRPPIPHQCPEELVQMMQRQMIEETVERSRAAARQEVRRAAVQRPTDRKAPSVAVGVNTTAGLGL